MAPPVFRRDETVSAWVFALEDDDDRDNVAMGLLNRTSQAICPALLHLNHLKNPLTGICYAHSRRRGNASSDAVSFVDEIFR